MNAINKRNLPLLLILIALVWIVFAVFYSYRYGSRAASRVSKPIKFATLNWEPYAGAGLPGNGPLCQFIAECIQRMGDKPEFGFYSWDVCLEKARNGTVWATFPGIWTDEREESYWYSDEIFKTEYVLFYRKDNPQLPPMEDPASRNQIDPTKFRLGKVSGYEVWSELRENLPADFEWKEFPSAQQAFQALANDEVDFIPEGKIVGLNALKGPGISNDFTEFGYVSSNTNDVFGAMVSWHLLVSKKVATQSFIDEFNAVLRNQMTNTVFKSQLESLDAQSEPSWMVEVRSADSGSSVPVFPDAGRSSTFLVPGGTRAMALSWPPGYSGNSGSLSRIKILNGPLQGRVMWIEPRHLILLNQ